MHLEGKAAVHIGGDDQTDGIEGVGEHLVERQVPGTRRGLIGHEDDNRLRLPLLELHLGHPRPHPPHVAGEGVGEQVLPRPVQLQLLGQLGALDKGVPGKLVDLLALLALLVGHNQLQVVPALGDVTVDEQPALLGLSGALAGQAQNIGMGIGMPHKAADIGLDYAQSDFH